MSNQRHRPIITSSLPSCNKQRHLNNIKFRGLHNDRAKCLSATNANAKTTEPFNENINIDSLYETQTNTVANTLASEIKNNLSYSIKPLVESTVQNMLVYPNPTNNYINIKYNTRVDGAIYMYDILGKEVLKTELIRGNKNVLLDLNSIINGVYTYKIIFDMQVSTGKLIKE